MLGETYPQAADQLRLALAAHDRIGRCWNTFLDEEPFDESCATAPDGSGRLAVAVRWPPDLRAELTTELRAFVDTLWACLDSLIVETVRGLGILWRPTDIDRPRFFPVADSPDGFAALLEEGCVDGILRRQQLLVSDCQPFRDSPTVPAAIEVRAALHRLLQWTHLLNDGVLVGACVMPVDPELLVPDGVDPPELRVAPAAVIDDEFTVATYQVPPGTTGIAGRTGSYVDIWFPDGTVPADDEDTLDARMKAALAATAFVGRCFARHLSEVGPLRRVADGPEPGFGTWLPAAMSPQRWTAEELRGVCESELGLGVVRGQLETTFIVATPEGVFERRIPTVSPLNHYLGSGDAAEVATHSAAATWGLPDFVLLPKKEHNGSQNLEISDGLLVTGELGAILQIKNREAPTDDPDRETSWLSKKIKQATRQIHGTARRLGRSPIDMTNGRGRRVRIDGAAVSWIGVVVIDHPSPPHDHPLVDHSTSVTAVVTLLRRDWEFLFDQLRSTRQVVEYLHRVAGPCETLGGEPERYFELAVADLRAEPDPPEPHMSGDVRSVPRLPLEPADHGDDPAAGIVRIMSEDIANSPFDGEELDRLRILAAVDSIPVAYRRELGKLLLDELENPPVAEDEIRWRFRRFDGSNAMPHLGFGVCSTSTEMPRDAFRTWVEIRQHERLSATPEAHPLFVGILLAPRDDGVRDWDTTLVALDGDPRLDDEEVRQRQRVWPDDARPPDAAVDQQ